MKIVLLARSLDVGGSERQLVALGAGLARRGHEVEVVTFYAGGALAPDLKAAGVPVRHLDKSRRWEVVTFAVRLGRLLRQLRPQVVYSFLTVPNVVAALLAPRGCAVVWGIRSSDMDLSFYDSLSRWAARLERGLAFRPVALVANSHSGTACLVGRGYPRRRMHVVPNGIDTERFRYDATGRSAVRSEWGVGEDEPVVGMVARLDPMKDYENFLKAAACVSGARFVCIGDGPQAYREFLQMQARALGLGGRMLWHGEERDPARMARLYSALDVLVLSSRFGEGFPNVVGEAMACGVPCIVTDVGDAARVVGDTGLVVPPRDPQALAGALGNLLREGPAAWRERGRRARARIESCFSLDSMVDATESLLLELACRGSST